MAFGRKSGIVVGVFILLATLCAVEPGLPSKTAVMAAAARAVGSKHPNPEPRNPDYLAIRFLGPRERAPLPDYPMDALDLDYNGAMAELGPRLPVSSHAFRTKAFDAAMLDALKAGARQVVVLGAGFDSRGYRFQSHLRGVRFMEVDYPPTQEDKKRRGEPWLFGFPDDGAAVYVRREGLDVISDVNSLQNICIAGVPKTLNG